VFDLFLYGIRQKQGEFTIFDKGQQSLDGRVMLRAASIQYIGVDEVVAKAWIETER
jgi:hypothetical protein